jgi:hypothetical protein
VTLVFNVLVTAAPKELAGDVGWLRGTTQNLAGGVGTALAGALLVGLLSSMIFFRLADDTVWVALLSIAPASRLRRKRCGVRHGRGNRRIAGR